MQLNTLKQAPFNTTMMGAMRGALDYYSIPVSDAMLYGASGHSFILNIHKQLCPSGPYCWNRPEVNALLENVGLRVEPLGFFWTDSGSEERNKVEEQIKARLEAGVPCCLMNMEYQLITGWDDTGFLTAQPWACSDFPPKHMTFGTWSELGNEFHIDFYALHRTDPVEMHTAVLDSLRYAVDLWRNPTAHTSDAYGMCPDGYANWKIAIRDGHGASHGSWWNATVYSECRARAADYFKEIAPVLPSAEEAMSISADFADVAILLDKCSDKALNDEKKVDLLIQSEERERECIQKIENLLEK